MCEKTPDGRGTGHDTFGAWTGGGTTGSADSRRVVCEVRRAARRAVAGRGAFVQVVRRLDTAVAEDIEHAPSGEDGRPGCDWERRSTAETIAVKPDDFPSAQDPATTRQEPDESGKHRVPGGLDGSFEADRA